VKVCFLRPASRQHGTVFKYNLLAKRNVMKRSVLIVLLAGIIASCNNADNSAVTQARQQQAAIDSMKTEMAKRDLADSMNRQNLAAQPLNDGQMTVAAAPRNSGGSAYNAHTYHGAATHHAVSSEVVATQAPATHKKKGWSAKAKGAVIGAGAGAVTGALVDKKKGRGALIGGLLGAGAGTGVGALIDNKNR
jgi:hypothetical protein